MADSEGLFMFNTAPDSLSITPELLGLSDIKVTGVRFNLPSNEIIISVISTLNSVRCRVCKKPTNGHGSGRQLHLRHLPMFGKETIIEITPRRGKCSDCDGGQTTTEVLSWYDANSKFTKPFDHRMLFELVNSTIADVSRKEGVDYHFVESLIDRYVETEVDFSSIDVLGILGIDEISMKKGYRDFVTLITYRINDKVHILGVVEGREKADVARFSRTIPRRLRKTIRAICCDLYDGYMSACKEVFKKIPVRL